ncbi:SusC/RagA family TonB-linked outer membrane protein [Pseudoflavitalea rhizosphaerae]|uniref:SusC/RagA family TonB-linked outer membrane protein n=1 Tax=Pseudoflavitalea rhizosphaerae TaxID=1884793 RepID=UPI000F8D5661|nr:SusC/RagA family TonB-linked outer membrane protein [Pseudoflavitalea rhizosphaerae]
MQKTAIGSGVTHGGSRTITKTCLPGRQALLVMKLIVVLLTAAFVNVSAEGLSQKVSYSGKNADIKSVFLEVEKQTGYLFVYNEPVLQSVKPVSIQASNLPLQQFLGLLFNNQPIDFMVKSKTILLFRKTVEPTREEPARIIIGAPPPPVTGLVTDENGKPMQGATVTVKNTKQAVVTGADGRFSIAAKTGDVLVVSFVNYEPEEVKVTDKSIRITLKPLIAKLEDAVVNGIYKRPVENYTGAAQSYTVEELRKVNNTNVLAAIRSLDASIQMPSNINAGSDPNQLPQIQVRGSNSIANTDLTSQYGYISNPPLLILDGFEVPLQRIYDLDMNRVARVTILKDAAATSIYGSKAANGVLVIETLQPKKGKLQFGYNNNLSLNTPDLTSYHLLNSEQKLQLELAAGIYNINSSMKLEEKVERERLYNQRLAEAGRGVNTYWLSKPLQTSFGQRHSIFLGGGDDYMRYGVDLAYNNAPGVMKGSKRENISGGVNLMYHKNNLQFTNYLSVTHNNSVNSPYGNFSQYAKMNPYWRPADSVTGKVNKILQGPDDPASWYFIAYNPLYNSTLKTHNYTKYLNVTNNFQADWNILPVLKFSTRFSMYTQKNEGVVFLPADAVEFVSTPDSLISTRGYFQQMNGNNTSYQGDVFLNYGKNFGKHTVFATGGYHIQQDRTYTSTITVQGFPNSEMDDLLFGLQYPVNEKPTGSETILRLVSYYGNFSYAYDYRYLLDVSFRRDGSSLFGSNQHFAPFWSVGIGWNLHKEKFIQLPELINRFKLRASYGSTGSQNFPSFASTQTYSYLTSTRYLDHIGATMLSLGNPDLRWQQTNKLNAGADLEFFKGRIQATVNYYQERTEDLFTSINTTPSSGFGNYFANLGVVQNKGIELYLTAFVMKNDKKNLYWSFYGNLLHNKNKLLKISDALKAQNDKALGEQTKSENPITAPVLQYKEGQSVSTVYAVRSLGIDPSTGNEIFLTRDGQQTYLWSPLDQVPVGDNQPKLNGNLGTNFMYKGISINVSMRTELGGQVYNRTLADRVENADPIYNVDERVLTDRWQKPGDQARFKGIATIGGTPRTDITKASSRFIQDNNSLYCDAITLGYLFPKNLTSKWRMSRFQCYFYINNPFVVSSVRQERGLDYPFARNYALSLQLGF